MAVTLGAASCCAVQIGYLETQNQPGSIDLQVGLKKALLSANNKQGFMGQEKMTKGAPTSGSGCEIQLKYIAPDCDAPTNVKDFCTDETATTDSPVKTTRFTFVEAAHNRGKVSKWTEAQFLCACEGKDFTVAATTDQQMKRIIRDEEQRLLTSAFACMGKYCDGTDSATEPKTANIFNADGTFAQTAGWDIVDSQMRTMGFTGKLIIVGGDYIRKFINLTTFSGTGADSLGALKSIITSGNYDFYYSSEFDSIISPLAPTPGNYAMVFAPGSTQILEYLQYDSEDLRRKTPTNVRTVISKTIDGVEHKFDYKILYDEGCESWKVLINRMSTTWCMPSDDYCPEVQGNGRFLIKLDCGVPGCDTSCTPA